jgi:alginate O-acetyltransferase complex protein AlgI
MQFTSLPFLLFFATVIVGYYGAPLGWRGRKGWLLAASWAFYATWSPRFLVLLIGTTWVDFQLARLLYRLRFRDHRPAAARLALCGSIALNLGVLAVFKYGRFLWEATGGWSAPSAVPAWLAMVAPLGVSFYTFHSISYVVDTYRGLRSPTDSFPDFALYVTFFPQLIAGPITRWGFFGAQLDRPPVLTGVGVARAAALLAAGCFKKVVCADSLGGYVDSVYQAPEAAGWVDAVLVLYAYAFQIYFDFSGYTEMAMGLAGFLGFRLPDNFDHPYLAASPSEFWRRWHISLSTWLRDYLYVPLGGNRLGTWRTYRNLLLTMMLGGLWHGAAWTFVLWGTFHGGWLAVHRLTDRGGAPRLPRVVRCVVTFHLVALGWVLFRAGSIDTAWRVFTAAGHAWAVGGPFPVGALALVGVGVVTHVLARRAAVVDRWLRLPLWMQGAGYGVVAALVIVFGARSGRFIYFQF